MVAKVDAITATKRWVENTVVGLNFCPFAKRELINHSVRFVSCSTDSMVRAVDWLLDECEVLDNHPQVSTTLLVFSDGFRLFDDFLLLLDEANLALARQDYEGVYQIAHFHPDYCFEGTAQSAAGNYTNRAPYPTLHLLREDSIARAVSHYPDADNIPVRNIEHANRLGASTLAALLQDCLKEP